MNNIVNRIYTANTGYIDLQPGITPFEFEVISSEGDTIIGEPSNPMAPFFNEIQIKGDPDLRRQYLPEGDDGSNILFMDDPNYEKLAFLRQHIATKDLPLTVSDDFVRRWAALASYSEEIIADWPLVSPGFPSGGDWGGLEILAQRNGTLDHIAEMDQPTRDALKAVNNSNQWAADYIVWRDTLPAGTRITYQP